MDATTLEGGIDMLDSLLRMFDAWPASTGILALVSATVVILIVGWLFFVLPIDGTIRLRHHELRDLLCAIAVFTLAALATAIRSTFPDGVTAAVIIGVLYSLSGGWALLLGIHAFRKKRRLTASITPPFVLIGTAFLCDVLSNYKDISIDVWSALNTVHWLLAILSIGVIISSWTKKSAYGPPLTRSS